ncbi:MAG: MlaD family protein [Polyangiaceae bacterium]
MKRALLLGLLLLLPTACEEVTGPAGYTATFDDVAGLKSGAPVFVAGVKVGRVKSVVLAEGKAKVELTVEGTSGVAMTRDACVSVGRYMFDPETHVVLKPGEGGEALGSGDEVSCVENSGLAQDVQQRLDRISESTLQLVEGLVAGKGTMGRLLRDEALAERVSAFFAAPPPKPADPEEKADEDAERAPEVSPSASPSAAPAPSPAPAPARRPETVPSSPSSSSSPSMAR